MKKRITSILLAFFVFMGLLPAPAAAAGEAWNAETADTSWYDETERVFTLTTAAQLAGLAQLVNGGKTFVDKEVELGADIDLENKAWTPIGTNSTNSFRGEFDGQGHTISNLYINNSGKLGLFGQIGCGASPGGTGPRRGAYLHDFTIRNAKMVGSGGIVAGSAFHDNVLENITVENAVITGTSSGSAIVGGVQSSQFKNIRAKNIDITSNKASQLGGMFGTIQGQRTEANLSNRTNGYYLPGTLTNDNKVVVSYFEDCHGEDITIAVKDGISSDCYIGGFAGYSLDTLGGDTALFNNCTLTNLKITVEKNVTAVGGFIGLRAADMRYTFTNSDNEQVVLGGFDGCSVQGTIEGQGGAIGGLAGYSQAYGGATGSYDSTYTNVTADVEISAAAGAKVGGLVGQVNTKKNAQPQTFEGCEVLGTTQIGDGEPVGSTLVGEAIMNNSSNSAIGVEGCVVPAMADGNLTEDQLLGALFGNPAGLAGMPVQIKHSVVFDTRGGSPVAPITGNPGDPVTAPAAPTKDGYVFAGWDRAIPDTMPYGGTVLRAVWSTSAPVAAVKMHHVKVEEAIAGGTVKAGPLAASAGARITLYITPETGNELAGLTVTDSTGAAVPVTPVRENRYSFLLPEGGVKVTARFQPENAVCPGDESCPVHGFADLDAGRWYHDGIEYCLNWGLMQGVGDGLFAPDEAVTREMIAVMLWNLAGQPAAKQSAVPADVADGQWYTEAVRWILGEKLTETSDGSFGVGETMCRQELVTVLWNYAKHMGYDVSVGQETNILSYGDAFELEEAAVPAMQWACGSGIIQGVPAEDAVNLDPAGSVTRAQAAAVFQRFCENAMKIR